VLKPTPGQLLGGIADSLRRSVLPALPPGNAQRQLKAALHALGRLERSWDRWPTYLAGDNADLRGTLLAALDALPAPAGSVPAALAERLRQVQTATGAAIAGIGDPALAQAAALNLELQELVAELDTWLRAPERAADRIGTDQLQVLEDLYRRMVSRELLAWGTAAAEAGNGGQE
jgi:hypothetical protein